MPITPEEIKFYQSTNKLGGPITATEVPNDLHAIFDIVDDTGSEGGETNYRCIYLKNTNSSLTLKESIIFILSELESDTSQFAIGLGTSPIGSSEQSIADETIPPIGVTFTELIGEAEALIIGNLAQGNYKAIWLRRIIAVNTEAENADGVTLRAKGKTGK